MCGLVFDLPDDCFQGLSRLAGGMRLDEVDVWTKSAIGDIPTAKAFPLKLIVLKATSFDSFTGQAGVSEVTFGSRPAALITTNPLSWDILMTT